MGFLDLFRMGKVLAGTIKAVRNQRELALELAALPMPEFVAHCLHHLNQSAGNWQGAPRPPHPQSAAMAVTLDLPVELAAFYAVCDGFEAVSGDFPARIHSIAELRTGGACKPALSALLQKYWRQHGNDSERAGWLSVLPPDDLAALATHRADGYLAPEQLDLALPLCPPVRHDFVVILRADAGDGMPRGTVLEIEGGSATRYSGFKSWLATRASLFGALSPIRS